VSIRQWEPVVVPGLLQTEEYARALITAWQPGDGADLVEQQVAARMNRQGLFQRESPPLLWAVIGETVLTCPVGGPQVLRGQLARLLEAARLPKVIIQVVPLAAGAHPGLEGPLEIIARADTADSCYLEVQGIGQIIDRSEDVARYSLIFDMLRAIALSPEASRELIAERMKDQ
jgi:Domain of unknown function (DUF5753)